VLMVHVSGRPAFDKVMGYIQKAKDAGGEVLTGGTGDSMFNYRRYKAPDHPRLSGDDSKGYFIQPTVILTKDPRSITMSEEIFGPVVTVSRAWQLNFPRFIELYS